MDWSKIFKERYPKYRNFAYSLTKDKAEADDLVMDVLTKLISSKKQEDAELSVVDGVVVQSIRNLFIDHYRRDKTFTRNEVDIKESLYSVGEDVSDDDGSNLRELIDAMDLLGERCKTVLSLFGLGYSYNEISVIEDIPLGTVMSRMARCRIGLGKIYGISS